MSRNFRQITAFPDFRTQATLRTTVTAIVFLTPFVVNNFIQGRFLLGVGSLAIVLICAFNAWSISRGGNRPWITLLVLVPAVILFMDFAFREQGIIGALWCYPAVLAFYFMLPERKAWLANVALLSVALPRSWLVLQPAVAMRVAVTLVVVSILSAVFISVIAGQHRQLQEQALTDPLTGLSNRILLIDVLDQAVEQSRLSGAYITLLAIDLDHFKGINDSMGHDAGDTVLRGFGELLRHRIRRSDRAFRLGGEEFLLLVYGTDPDNGRRFAEELREEVESVTLLPDRQVTVSIGVATLRPEENWRDWMKRADENLYRAKSAGRNRIVA